MKIKVILDLSNKESFDIINYFSEYRKKNADLNLDIHGFDLNEDNKYNKVYYGLHYANKFGVGLEYLQRVLNAHYLEGQDITQLNVLAQAYQDIGYNSNDFIDAMMEGDYEEMHEYFQIRYKKENICNACTGLIFDSTTKVFTNLAEIKEYMENNISKFN